MKPENILISDAGVLKLADYGAAVHAPPPMHTRRTFCGTAEYLAPEMIIGGGYMFTVDNWALGVLLYELLHGM